KAQQARRQRRLPGTICDNSAREPGGARVCFPKIGQTVWMKARERTKAALGARYNIKDFHSAGLDCGRVPLDVLDGVIDRYIAQAKTGGTQDRSSLHSRCVLCARPA